MIPLERLYASKDEIIFTFCSTIGTPNMLEHMEKDLEQRALDAWEAGYTPVFEAHLPVI
jgi:hypothetical protein